MNTKLNALFHGQGYDLFVKAVQDIARSFGDILGVLCVGSLVHAPRTPDNFFTPEHKSHRGLAYEKIRNPGRRRLRIHEGTDLDLWICTKDTSESRAAQAHVERAATALLSELASGTIKWGTERWHNKKESVFRRYYKQNGLYPNGFISQNGDKEPWMARRFKELLEQRVTAEIPEFIEEVNRHFEKKIPGSFFEIRAFPESLFHLRPDDSMMPNMQMDRMPFPRIMNGQLISPEHSSLVMYATEDITIYPFRENGRILGSSIRDFLIRNGSTHNGKTYGGFVIKPDAFRKKQSDIVMAKIIAGIAEFNGNIVAERTIPVVSELDVETMYPLLKERPLAEAKDYLVGGEMTILIIESELSSAELFKNISTIKGPRLIDRTYERLMEGRILDGSIRDLLPVPGEEHLYKAVLPAVLAKKADLTTRFTDDDYKYYAQNLVHSPDNEIELDGLFLLAGFSPT